MSWHRLRLHTLRIGRYNLYTTHIVQVRHYNTWQSQKVLTCSTKLVHCISNRSIGLKTAGRNHQTLISTITKRQAGLWLGRF